jgi:hypothetical protein
VALSDDLERIATAASPHGSVAAVLAAEPVDGVRRYLVALGGDDGRRWLVLDDAGNPLTRREDVRDVASIAAICEVAGDFAGGGDVTGLREHIRRLRDVEGAAGLDEAEAAAIALERTVGEPPRVATPAYLDAVGEATVVLDRALGDLASPFSSALRAGSGAVEAFVREVERDYALPL